ncbi:MAG: GTPase Era [Bacteroidota bacterium]
MNPHTHRAGFVHLIGKPNAGKSTLFNALVKQPLSIVTHKPQTTRQDLLGIVNTPHSQTIYVDTPGHIKPTYPLQKAMVKSIKRTLPGADLILYVIDARQELLEINSFKNLIHPTPTFLLLNKIDLLTDAILKQKIATWSQQANFTHTIPLSAKHHLHIDQLTKTIEAHLPHHPPFYDKQDITDKPIQFFIAEIIRKIIFLQYQQEVPYSTSVIVTNYQEEKEMTHIEATIYTERTSQKSILIGKQGKALEKLCVTVRKELNHFLGQKIFFKPHIKVSPNWRKNPKIIQQWGY